MPDLALHRPGAAAQWHRTTALLIEIVSPGDETWTKPAFYAAHNVDEVLILDPAERTITWLALTEGGHRHVEGGDLIELGSAALAEQLDWP